MYQKLAVVLLSVTMVSARQINEAGLNLIVEFANWYPNFYTDSKVSI